MRTKSLAVASVVAVFVVLTAVLVYLGRGAPPAGSAASGAGSVGSATDGASPGAGGASAGMSSSETASGTDGARDAAVDRPASNVPMTPLGEGEKPPQFVLFSFDGAGSHDQWQQFLAAAEPTDARFTAFVSGVYLLTDDHADAYTGPGHEPGQSTIGFGGSRDDVLTEVADLRAAYAAGHEIGTHYNGHFCAGNSPSGDDWTASDFSSELDQFFEFVDKWRSINGFSPDDDAIPSLGFSSGDIRGGRIPCLEGDLDAASAAWKSHGMTYDSSKNLYTGIGWPKQIDGVWEFQIPYVYSPAFGRNVIPTNYNLWATFNGAKHDPDTAAELSAKVRKTYDYMFEQAYRGNRAPVVIENHFNDWDSGAFTSPALGFMTDTCGKPDVYCATFSDVVSWMEAQDPAVLAALQAQPVVAAGS